MGLASARIASLDAALIYLLPEPVERARRTAKLVRAPGPVLADPRRQVFRSFGFGRPLFLIQRSGTAVVDREGRLAYVHRSTSPRRALDLPELMRAVEQAGA